MNSRAADDSHEIQEKVFKALLSRPENKNCADCNALNPTWASLDFGVFICYNCSGFHRELGPTVTRVKSLTLDKWNNEWFEIMTNHGNSKANEYWECNVSSYYNKPKSNEEMRKFIQDKYLKRMFVPKPKQRDPVSSFFMAKKRKEIPEFNVEEVILAGSDPVIVKPKSPPIIREQQQNYSNYNEFATFQPKRNKDMNADWKTFDKKKDAPVIVPQKIVTTDWTGQKIEKNEKNTKNEKNDNINWFSFPKNNTNNNNNFDDRAFKTVSNANRQEFLNFNDMKKTETTPKITTNTNLLDSFKDLSLGEKNSKTTTPTLNPNTKNIKNAFNNNGMIMNQSKEKKEVNLLDLSPNHLNNDLLSPNFTKNEPSQSHRASPQLKNIRPSSVDIHANKMKQPENNFNNNSGNLQKGVSNNVTPVVHNSNMPLTHMNMNNNMNLGFPNQGYGFTNYFQNMPQQQPLNINQPLNNNQPINNNQPLNNNNQPINNNNMLINNNQNIADNTFNNLNFNNNMNLNNNSMNTINNTNLLNNINKPNIVNINNINNNNYFNQNFPGNNFNNMYNMNGLGLTSPVLKNNTFQNPMFLNQMPNLPTQGTFAYNNNNNLNNMNNINYGANNVPKKDLTPTNNTLNSDQILAMYNNYNNTLGPGLNLNNTKEKNTNVGWKK